MIYISNIINENKNFIENSSPTIFEDLLFFFLFVTNNCKSIACFKIQHPLISKYFNYFK